MATVALAAAAATQRPSRASNVKVPYLVERVIDLATAATTKGSALASGDVLEAIRIPAESVVLAASFEVTQAVTGGSADQAVTLGDGGDADRWVTTFDLDAAAAGDYAPIVIATSNPTVFKDTDTVDLTISAGTTIGTAGKIRVFALMVDASDRANPGLAQLKS